MEYRPNVFIQLILCVHSFKTFSFVIYLLFARWTSASTQVFSSRIGTPFPSEYLSLIYVSQYTVSRIYWLSWWHDRCPQHCVSYTWSYVAMQEIWLFAYPKWSSHFPCRRYIHLLSSNLFIGSSKMNGQCSMRWPHPLSCPCCNGLSWSSRSMCRISIESTDQRSSTIIVVSMSSTRSSTAATYYILILINEYHVAVVLILDLSKAPHSSELPRIITNNMACL